MTMDVSEKPMERAQSKPAVVGSGAVRQCLPEAYDYRDDVTAEGMALVRQRAAAALGDRQFRPLGDKA